MSLTLAPPTPEQKPFDPRDEDLIGRPYTIFNDEDDVCRPPDYKDIESFDVLIDLLLARPQRQVEAADVEDPRRLIDALLGPVDEEFLQGIGDLRADSYKFNEETSWAEIIVTACQVASTNPQYFFNKLETPATAIGAPCSRQHESELEYLKSDINRIHRAYDVIGALLLRAGPYVFRVRMEWTAVLIKIIHLCSAIFKPWMRAVVGDKAILQKRLAVARSEVQVYKEPRTALMNFTSGSICNVDMFIYEVLVHLAMPDVHMNHFTIATNLICFAEYNAVRCAVDASSSSTLYVCLMSMSYICDVWTPYMSMYFPRVFVVHENENEEVQTYRNASPPLPWSHLIFYLPDERQHSHPDPEELFPLLQEYFVRTLSPEFRTMFVSISMSQMSVACAPLDEIFTVKDQTTLASRRSQRVKKPAPSKFDTTPIKRARKN